MLHVIHLARLPDDDLVMEFSQLVGGHQQVLAVVAAELKQGLLQRLQRFRVPCAGGDPKENFAKGRLSVLIGDERTAGQQAVELKASRLFFVTRVQGVLSEECRLISRVNAVDIRLLMGEGIIDGRMGSMAQAALDALAAGILVEFGRSLVTVNGTIAR